MKKIIFVCHGNICRSPMAEFIMKDFLRLSLIKDVEVISRAMHSDELGSDMYPYAKRELDMHYIPYTKHKATLMTKEDYDSADIVAVMDDANLRDLAKLVPNPTKAKKLLAFAGEERDVADPWYTRDFNTAFFDIITGCDALLKMIRSAKKA